MSKVRLPEICYRCRKLKSVDKGRFFRLRGRYHPMFICHDCDLVRKQSHEAERERERRRSPSELAARRALLNCGFPFKEEFKVHQFHFDFAVPSLGLLIEIDSWTYHHTPARKNRDRRKTRLAERDGWIVKRISSMDVAEIEDVVSSLVKARAEKLEDQLGD